eukprot:scaffold281549_cov36-Tisochrysis_lutea.AAC.3
MSDVGASLHHVRLSAHIKGELCRGEATQPQVDVGTDELVCEMRDVPALLNGPRFDVRLAKGPNIPSTRESYSRCRSGHNTFSRKPAISWR